MIIYNDTKSGFIDDILNGVLDEKIDALMVERYGRRSPESEQRAWRNSLTYMGNIIGSSSIPEDAGIAIEYGIPYTSKRVDLIVTGLNESGCNSAVIIELKQWASAEAVPGKDGVVRTAVGNGIHEVAHPSYQAWSYAEAIEDFNADVREEGVVLSPCACLHNYVPPVPDPLRSEIYGEYLAKAPVFSKHEGADLRRFLERFIKRGDRGETVFILDRGRLRPSKSLQDVLSSMMAGNQEFVLLDTQKVVYEEILQQARAISKGGSKRVVIVKGGPGTGKSVLAINLLSEIITMGMSALYVSKNSAPRNVYTARLKGQKKGRSRIDKLFTSSGKFMNAKQDAFDVLITDEAHRLREHSDIYNKCGENQVKEIINASKMSIFFIDEDQTVTLSDIGSVDLIRSFAIKLGASVTEMELDSQFRCSGSDGYLAWLDNALQIRETANLDLDDSFPDYDFRVYDDPNELRRDIEERNRANNRSRMVAGYCWKWITAGKKDSNVHDVKISEFGFEMSWNLNSTDTWAIDPESINEIGCVHTCQGLEFDYVGVIIGDDMRYENNAIITDASKRASTDRSLWGIKSYKDKDEARRIADRIIKNTYKVLMTRGMKGCYVYCTDEALAEHFREMMGRDKRGFGRNLPALAYDRWVPCHPSPGVSLLPMSSSSPTSTAPTLSASSLMLSSNQPAENTISFGASLSPDALASSLRRSPRVAGLLRNLHSANSM